MDVLESVGAALVVALVCAAAAQDLWMLRIANTFSIAIAGLYGVLAVGALLIGALPLATLGTGLGLTVLVFIGTTTLFAFRMLGGGDVKLLTAISLWIPAAGLPAFLLIVVLAGGVVSLLVLLVRLLPRAIVPNGRFVPAFFTETAEKRQSVPYGLAIATGTVAIWWLGALGVTAGVVR